MSEGMRRLVWLAGSLALPAAALAACSGGVLHPAGPVAGAERLIVFNSTAIMLAIVAPTIVTTLVFAWWFRASNPKARRRPDWEFSGRLEAIVWAIPLLVILFLGGIAWSSSHVLDPAKPLKGKPIEIQVVSLDWKWLFIYPDYNVATVNQLVLPTDQPAHFSLTSSTVMNSFFIPQLGSQIYTMAGMVTHLNLMPTEPGIYDGLSAHFSGDGFAGMHFQTRAAPRGAFDAWMASVRGRSAVLDQARFAQLAAPSQDVPPTAYAGVEAGLFDTIVRRSRAPVTAVVLAAPAVHLEATAK